MEEGICKIFMRRVSLNTFWYCMARVGWLDGRITIHSGGGDLIFSSSKVSGNIYFLEISKKYIS